MLTLAAEAIDGVNLVECLREKLTTLDLEGDTIIGGHRLKSSTASRKDVEMTIGSWMRQLSFLTKN